MLISWKIWHTYTEEIFFSCILLFPCSLYSTISTTSIYCDSKCWTKATWYLRQGKKWFLECPSLQWNKQSPLKFILKFQLAHRKKINLFYANATFIKMWGSAQSWTADSALFDIEKKKKKEKLNPDIIIVVEWGIYGMYSKLQ